MKAILIDSKTQQVREVEVEEGEAHVDSMYRHLVCDCFAVPHVFDNEDSLYVDDEGLLKPLDMFFILKGAPQPYAGNGLILGTNRDGESVDAKSKLDEIRKSVQFVNALEMKIRCARGEFNNC